MLSPSSSAENLLCTRYVTSDESFSFFAFGAMIFVFTLFDRTSSFEVSMIYFFVFDDLFNSSNSSRHVEVVHFDSGIITDFTSANLITSAPPPM